ncbi:YceH family protein [Pseudoalteromonas sp. MTN2-4]|uniref:YceH family protein n=1 Tax=Pseudoalteromonas sp. MTN2-4 TaxID=3056555 RepID=UPI0036F407EB
MELNQIEQRIIGVLLEKEITTPDQYPLSLNSLTTGCNQKSNREPVLELSEAEVLDAIDGLIAKRIVVRDEAVSGRVDKYRHRFCNTEFGDLQFSEQQLAIVCVLLLRGPQTPGELRSRTNRLANFAQVSEVEQVLQDLQQQSLTQQLPRQPGKRESRYQHLFISSTEAELASAGAEPLAESDLNSLLEEVQQLKQELAKIKQHLGL